MTKRLEALAKSWNCGAAILIQFHGEDAPTMTRPAAFVYPGQDRLAWVEPSYLDPYGAASPALHKRIGKLREPPGGGIEILTITGEVITAIPFSEDTDEVREPLEWFKTHLAESETQWGAERERVRSMIKDE